MGEGPGGFPRRYREGAFSVASVGVFFILVGLIFVTKPDLFERILDLFRNVEVVKVPNTDISLPAPQYPSNHLTVYRAVEQFSFFWGLFQLVILAFRYAARSPVSKKAETISNFVFWIGVHFLVGSMLVRTITLTTWFSFWSVIIMLIGASLVIRGIALAVGMAAHRA